MGSALLVFLVNLSVEQSVSQKHEHKIIGYTALFCMSTWKSQCRREAGSPGVMLRVSSERLWGRNLVRLFPPRGLGRPVGVVFQLSGPNGVRGLWGTAHTVPHCPVPCPLASAGAAAVAPSPRCNQAGLVPVPCALWKWMQQYAKGALFRDFPFL